MGDKGVGELAGIGEVLGKRLTDKGYDKVRFKLLSSHLSQRPRNRTETEPNSTELTDSSYVVLAGVRRARPVPALQEEQHSLLRLAQRGVERQRQTVQRLCQLLERMVRRAPVMHLSCALL